MSEPGGADHRTPIVGVGASAGGVKALISFFEAVPPEIGVTFVVIVHLDPQARSELPSILKARSRLSVTQVQDKHELKPNCIYVIPPDRQLHITDHEIAAVPFDEPRGQRAPIDIFFRSLAEQHGDGFAVILSGAGSDGAAGVTAIKEHGGIVLVQSPDEAEFPSMPRSAIATEVADFVLPVRQLAERLVDLARAKQHAALPKDKADEDDQVRRILAHVRVRTGHDFSLYKRSTILRRIVRRMQVTRKETLDEYFLYLRETAEEAQNLLSDLLISVTTFFRDPRAFDALSRLAIADIFQKAREGHPLRVWVAGCATGEEAYSIAMLLLEEAALHEIRPEIQVFGSDMDARGLSIAREGRYPVAIEADLSEERLRRFFTREGEYYRVKRELRDTVLFASHSVLKDPPFSRVDLISCRNLLIYLDRDLQQQVLATLHYALNPDGYLFLGSSESAETPNNLFRVIDRDARLYQSTGRMPDRLPSLPRLSGLMMGTDSFYPNPSPTPVSARASQGAHREALENLAPPSILVDTAFRVLHLSETAGRYLLPSGGPLTTDVTDLVRPELRFELRAALHRAFERSEKTLSGAISVRFNGHPVRVYVHVKPVSEADASQPRKTLILFVEGEEHEPVSVDDGAQPSSEALQRLKQELELAQSRLRTMREESEAANEELRAANEELQSINEEYRSTAEELETSKEELQSINEELQTVNSELKLKLESVSRSNSDLQNLMAATDFATLFLDPGLRIKRFTPKLAELFNITPNDIGRPITDFTHQLDYDDLPSDATKVLDDLSPIEREVRSRKDGWYLVRFRPYRTVDDKIDGVVVTFIDVTERQRMQDALKDSERRMRAEMRIVDLSRFPVFVWDFDSGQITQWNHGCELYYGYTRDEAVGRGVQDLLLSAPSIAAFGTVRDTLAASAVWNGELTQTAKGGATLKVDGAMELITADGRRLVLESERTTV
ncbi:MAG: PAS domain-containing protein [Alphaproteobacteria bacterium]|nr:PAS domain-containing protein [Alphaproteobacteria bacterium]